MTGLEIIDYIEKNKLHNKEVIVDGCPYGYMNVEQAAIKLDVTVTTIRQWITREKLPSAIKLGGEWFLPLEQEYPPRKKAKKKLIDVD